MIFIDDDIELLFEPILKVNLNEYVGKFYSQELDTYYKLSIEGDQIVARHQRNKDIFFNPITISEAVNESPLYIEKQR